MKKLFIIILTILPALAFAQSVNVRIIASDGSITTTNTVNLSADLVQGLLTIHNENNVRRTNNGSAALNFSTFIVQELGDKGVEWKRRAGNDAATTFAATMGITNLNIPLRLAEKWADLTATQRTNAINYVNGIGP